MAPSGPVDLERLEIGLELLRSRGYELEVSEGVQQRWRYLAGPDTDRGRALSAALTRPDVDAVWAARGGYGAMRLLGALPWEAIAAASPRWLVGFSDITALHCAALSRGLGGVVHGPNITTLAGLGATDRAHLFGLLEASLPAQALGAEGLQVWSPGSARGPLFGGNLSLLCHLVGSPWFAVPEDAVLFLEDVGEQPYRLDRLLTHLELAGVFGRISGVLVGEFSGCDSDTVRAEEVLRERLCRLGLPVVASFPAGHGDRLRALALGGAVALHTSPQGKGQLEVLEAPCPG